MSYHDDQDIKDILFLVNATYTAYRAYRELRELKEKSGERKKRRMQDFERNRMNDGDSSSSEEEIQPEQDSCFLGSTDSIEIANQRRQSTYSVEEINMNPRRNKRKSSSSEGCRKLTESFASKFSDQQFKKNFRISRKTMVKMHDSFVSSTEYKNIFKLNNEPKIPAQYYMMMFLWFAGKTCSYLSLARVFKMSLSRSCSTVDTVTQFFLNSAKDYIRFPETPAEKRLCAENFQEVAGFPNVLGCLINTPIELRTQGTSPSESITATIQAICDSKGRFLDVYVNASRKVHHTEMLQESPIGEKLKEICQGRYHILAEGEYNVREWLLTPFKEPNTPGHTLYNQRHRSTMEEVWDSVGALQRRFQQLTSMNFSPHRIKRMIIACCVLHNICLEENDYFDMDDPLAIPSSVVGHSAEVLTKAIADDTHLRRIGELKRRQIMEELKRK